mgnify:CR=1 FL=1
MADVRTADDSLRKFEKKLEDQIEIGRASCRERVS